MTLSRDLPDASERVNFAYIVGFQIKWGLTNLAFTLEETYQCKNPLEGSEQQAVGCFCSASLCGFFSLLFVCLVTELYPVLVF